MPYVQGGLSHYCGCSSQWAAQIASKLLCLRAAEAPGLLLFVLRGPRI